jgi:hypothetical protein
MLLKKTSKLLPSNLGNIFSALKNWNAIASHQIYFNSEAKGASLSDAEGEQKEGAGAKASDDEEAKETLRIEEEKFKIFSQTLFLKEQIEVIEQKLKLWNEVTPLNLFHTFLPNKANTSTGEESVRRLNRIDFLKVIY